MIKIYVLVYGVGFRVIGWIVDTFFNFSFHLQPLKLLIMIKKAPKLLFTKSLFVCCNKIYSYNIYIYSKRYTYIILKHKF